MFKKNMSFIFGIALIISLDAAFGLPDPRVQFYGSDYRDTSLAYYNPMAYGYTPSRYGYHKLYTDANIWSVASVNCRRDGGHLAIVNSAGEAEYLRTMLQQERYNIRNAFNNWNAFIGITDEDYEGYWYTIFGQPLRTTGYSTWASYDGKVQPDNGKGDHEENCGSLTPGAVGLSDVSCYARFAYFCELQ